MFIIDLFDMTVNRTKGQIASKKVFIFNYVMSQKYWCNVSTCLERVPTAKNRQPAAVDHCAPVIFCNSALILDA